MLTVHDVAVGDALPELHHDITTTTVVLGALGSRDWRRVHHDRDAAVNGAGMRDIFLGTPNQAAWFERYVTDWAGPRARLGRMTFRMRDSVFPGDTMRLAATVVSREVDRAGCGWLELAITLTADDGSGPRVATTCDVRVAVPTAPDDNPWQRRGDRWLPSGTHSGRQR
jgi:acyl dehydratase